MIKPNDELAREYLKECSEFLTGIERDLLSMESGGAELDGALVDRVFRAFKSITEGAAFFDLHTIRDLAQEAGNALTVMPSRAVIPPPDRIGVLLRASDRLLDLLRDPEASNHADTGEILTALTRLRRDQQAAASAELPFDKPSDGPKYLKVLLVEDDFASRLMLQTFLGRYGECHVAVNGIEAVKAFGVAFEHGPRYDLICMDIMMPEMDGREAVRQIRAIEQDHGVLSTAGAKIIMTTAVSDIKIVSDCFNDLCDGYLKKPIDLAGLLHQMRSYHLVS